MSTATAPTNDVWSMEVPQPGGDYTPCPAGNYPARICGLYDIGHHPEEKTDDKTKAKSMVDTHKVVIVFELAEKQANGKPFTMGLKLTWSMHEKSNFFKLVTGITGVKLQPNTTFNPCSILGTPVLVNVVQKPGKENKVHANVETVSQWMKGLSQPTWEYSPVAWSVREVGKPFPEFGWLPLIYGKSIKALAGECTEARGFTSGQQVTTNAPASAAATGAEPGPKAYAANVRELMAKYGLQEGYGDQDLAEASGLITGGMPLEHRDILENGIIPF